MKISVGQSAIQSHHSRAKLSEAIHGSSGPERARALETLGSRMRETGAFDLSHRLFEEAFALDPDSPEISRSLGLSRCRMGDLAGGLELYDSGRWKLKSFRSIWRDFPQPQWQGQNLRGKKMLLWAEQGVGDQIMQARCLKWIVEQHPKAIFVECDPRLYKLIETSFPGVKCMSQTVEPSEFLLKENFDFQTSLLSAWKWTYACDPDVNSGYPAYLTPDDDFRTRFRNVWAENGWKYNVGISWRSSSKVTGDRKSIDPELWAPLLENPEVHFHSLQYDCDSAELDRLSKAFGRRLLEDRDGDPKMKLYRLTAQIAALDLVISIDNTTVHIAGALGTPCVTLLPKFNDWRWGMGEPKTFLYDSMTLLRQTESENWDNVILEAGLILRDTFAGNRRSED